MSASQDFRDGCAYAAQTLVERIKTVDRLTGMVRLDTIEAIATTFAQEMGGFVDQRTMNLVKEAAK